MSGRIVLTLHGVIVPLELFSSDAGMTEYYHGSAASIKPQEGWFPCNPGIEQDIANFERLE
jgi:hypothetical protein